MDLLKTILIYMSMVFAASVQNAPEATMPPLVTEPPPAITAPATLIPTTAPQVTVQPTPVPTPDITPNSQYRTIRVRDNGDEVREMQRRLAELGYYDGDIDGRFGNQTRRAVERFQYNNGLTADGIAGKQTLTVLFESEKVVSETAPTMTPAPSSAEQTPAPTETATPAPTFAPTAAPTAAANSDEADTKADAAVAATEPIEPTEPPVETTPLVASQSTAVPLEDSGFVLDGQNELMVKAVQSGKEPMKLVPLEVDGNEVFVPFFAILENAEVAVVSSMDESNMEYAFAFLADYYHFSCRLDEQGNPEDIAVSQNGKPQLMVNRKAFLQEGILYLPLIDVEEWTGVAFAKDENVAVYTVTLPSHTEEAQ